MNNTRVLFMIQAYARNVLMLAICFSSSFAKAQNALPRNHEELVPIDGHSCVFADSKATFLYHSQDQNRELSRSLNWQVDWALVVGNRTIRRGTSEATSTSDSDVSLYQIEIPTPPLKEGVTLPVELQMIWTAGNHTYRHNRRLHVFSKNPFVLQQVFLENAQIKVFDPEGSTAELFEESDIPHSRLLNLSSIDIVTEGLILVGEGTSFREQRRLSESLLLAAQRGVSVLCLAPSEGDIPLSLEQVLKPKRLVFERAEVVRRYDKRFDKIPTIRPLSLQPSRGGVVISTDQDACHWSWVSMEFPTQDPKKPAGKMIICNLGMIRHWQSSPVPRYLFARLIEDFTNTPRPLEEQKNASLPQ